MLAFGYSPEQVAEVYERFVPKVFTFCLIEAWWNTGNLWRCRYRQDNVEQAAESLFGDYTYEVCRAVRPAERGGDRWPGAAWREGRGLGGSAERSSGPQ
jgi:hypothetical protein